MTELFLGLISGTSVDAIDAAVVEVGPTKTSVRHAISVPFTDDLRRRIVALAGVATASIEELGQVDNLVGQAFADAATSLLSAARIDAAKIAAIGSHGQTIRHQPALQPPFTIQIGDPNVIAAATGITTVADFRRRDMALGGQGAPLVPAFHKAALGVKGETRAVINIGGIANLTLLAANGEIGGFDSGPGNTLLDRWIAESQGSAFDRDGQWAAKGEVCQPLLTHMLRDPYFHAASPKSTGPEYFNLDWLEKNMAEAMSETRSEVSSADVQATLAELTAQSIASAVLASHPSPDRILICGGGVHNSDLVARIAKQFPDCPVSSTAAVGIDPNYVEAAAFAWLARQTMNGLPGNVPAVTGARSAAVLGGIYPA